MCFAKKKKKTFIKLNQSWWYGHTILFADEKPNKIRGYTLAWHHCMLGVIQIEISFKSDEDENWKPSLPQ